MPRGLYDLFLINTNQREVVCERGVLQGLDALISDAIALRRKIVSARVE
ncbi:hypothetical protein [Gluconacetobacter dulcium]|nr:hypothetical protein [Gluconacetobacter dulcium]